MDVFSIIAYDPELKQTEYFTKSNACEQRLVTEKTRMSNKLVFKGYSTELKYVIIMRGIKFLNRQAKSRDGNTNLHFTCIGFGDGHAYAVRVVVD